MPVQNPYASPETAIADPRPAPRQPVYRSRGRAFLGGMWRGAKLGGTWTAIIFGSILGAVWLFLLAMLVYRWLVQGVDLLELADLPRNLVMTLGLIALCSLDGAIIGALVMGTAAAITYRRPGREAPGEPSPSHPSSEETP